MKAILRSGFLTLAIMVANAGPANAGPYEDGEAAYEREDYATALKFWRPLAELGHAKAMFNLALMHVKGDGVPQDYVSAQMWFNIAAALGNEKAQKAQNMVVNLMTPDQITAAQLLAREWMSETLNSEVRGPDPKEVSRQEKIHDNSQLDTGPKVPGERIGYKFSKVMFGEYCETAFIQLLKASVSGPVAMALGEESCGIGGAGTETVTDAEAEAEALEKCKSATTGCRIIFTKGAD